MNIESHDILLLSELENLLSELESLFQFPSHEDLVNYMFNENMAITSNILENHQKDDPSLILKTNLYVFQQKAFNGNMLTCQALRGIIWRLFFGLLTGTSYKFWCLEMDKYHEKYIKLQQETIACSLSNRFMDIQKLNTLKQNRKLTPIIDIIFEDISKYNHKLDNMRMIKIDVDRLYLNGIPDEYFQESERRKSSIIVVLLLWAMNHPSIGYRQGMHEIAGTIVYVLDIEYEAMQSLLPNTHSLYEYYKDYEYYESHLYWMFNHIIKDMLPLYSPIMNKGGNVPIVDFSTRIQEQYLRQIDFDLYKCLNDQYIEGQLYIIKWARLLFGREFDLSSDSLLALWDYMFASCCSTSTCVKLVKRYKDYTPLMSTIADFILAMVLYLRPRLIESDVNDMLRLLIRFPTETNVDNIIDVVNMIRKEEGSDNIIKLVSSIPTS